MDGLRLMLKYYRNHGSLHLVHQKTGVSMDKLKRFCDGEDCLTSEEDKILREPLKEFGDEVTFS